LEYIREMDFNAIELLPVHEFSFDRSWGYNPASFFAPESAYGSPQELKEFVNGAHGEGLAVIFDVVYNHAGPVDNVLWRFDGSDPSGQGGIYFEGGKMTHWGRGPAWWKKEVQDFFFENACMFIEDYRADGLRFDATTQINGYHLRDVVWRLRERYPEKYIIAEHLPAHPWITTSGHFSATWCAKAHHECQRALTGDASVEKMKAFLGYDGFEHAWNLVKYTLGSHDDCGDQEEGDAEDGKSSWDKRHRYLINQFGGRDNWHARSKCRLAWALNIAMPGTPMMFMGGECHMGAPNLPWGYWHDGADRLGDHRFDWSIAGDPMGMEMRRFVKAANGIRWNNPALRSDTLAITHEDDDNHILAFKRWAEDNVVLSIINMGEESFDQHRYGVRTGGQNGRWRQILCTQDAAFGGWNGAGNAFYEPWTQTDGCIYINLPKWSAVLFQLT
jgi:1,4-alpha-glucan branching enzyme